MLSKKQEIKKMVSTWNQLIQLDKRELKKKLSDVQLSALSTWVEDCYESFEDIYYKYLNMLNQDLRENNIDEMHDIVVEIYMDFQHIKGHIQDAEEGFLILMNTLAKKVDEK